MSRGRGCEDQPVMCGERQLVVVVLVVLVVDGCDVSVENVMMLVAQVVDGGDDKGMRR